MDEQQRGRIRDDLKGFFRGDLLFDDLPRSLYSTDASIFQVMPAGVALPRDEEDLCALVQYAQRQGVPLVARGAGTGLAGESLGRGLIVDLSRHFRGILEVGPDTVRVQPGVVLHTLQARLKALGRRFAPDPASGYACTIGGMLATNASGANALTHGYTRDHVESLRIVLDNGEAASAGRIPLPLPAPTGCAHLNGILEALVPLLEANQTLIRSAQPATRFNRLGYLLTDVYGAAAVDLPKLLIGSEGTLGIFTEATLRTVPLPGAATSALLAFARLEQALLAAQALAPLRPASCDLLDRRLFALARGKEGSSAALFFPPVAEAVLLVEFEADSAAEAQSRLTHGLGRLEAVGLAPLLLRGEESAELLDVRQLRDAIMPSLYAVKGGAQPAPLIEDVGVPLDRMAEYVFRLQEVLKEHEISATFLIHATSGQVHARPFLDLTNPEHASRLIDIAEKAHALALSLGGTVSTQHGAGLARTAWVARQYPTLYPVLRQIKAIFDPRGILNPGKIVDPDPQLGAWPLRAATSDAGTAWRLDWREGEASAEINHCNGCGACRTEAPEQRMCPILRADPREEAAPRAKANLLRHLLATPENATRLAASETRQLADLCVNCKMCAHECPARVNIPKLMLETKAAYVAQHGLERGDWLFANLERVLRWGSILAFLANFMLRSSLFRWLLEKMFGLAAARRLPRIARRSFWRVAKRNGWRQRKDRGRPSVVYFPELYVAYVEPELGVAACRVLEHNGFDVYVPPGLRSSGAEALVAGDVETARERARTNLRVLADLAREGLPIVCSEPTAALMLRQDYPDLGNDLDAQLVSKQVIELMAFLGALRREDRLRLDFQALSLRVGHHVPCHIKALGGGTEASDLLRSIPGLTVDTLDVSCSGMAGTYGLKARNVTASLAAGRPMLEELRTAALEVGASECSSCRLQMENGAGKRTLHPVQYLALAYGLTPELAARLKQPIKGKVLG
ncbi:MAG: FAD-linked oxidase C-terminal domain-containing protein [Gemmataceae bacterium]